jgi:hypothetical protein
MIFLTEMCLYWQWCHMLGKDAGEVGTFFKGGGVTGHSQGVICALVVALAQSDKHFDEVTMKFLKYSFFHGQHETVLSLWKSEHPWVKSLTASLCSFSPGVRVQQAYPSKTLPAKGQCECNDDSAQSSKPVWCYLSSP